MPGQTINKLNEVEMLPGSGASENIDNILTFLLHNINDRKNIERGL
jgi:hypothetical protein